MSGDGQAFALRFAVGALATWRVTHLIADEDGPGGVVLRFRARLGQSQLGQLMDCFACASVWVAAPVSVAVARDPKDIPLVLAALSGAACLLERAAPATAASPEQFATFEG